MRTSRCTPDFGLQPAIGVLALDQNGRRFDAGLLAFALPDDLDLVAVPLRPAHIHAQEHLRPNPGFRCRRRRHGSRDRCRWRPPRPRAAIPPRSDGLRRAASSARCSASATTLASPSSSPSATSSTLSSSSRARRVKRESVASSCWRSRMRFARGPESFQKLRRLRPWRSSSASRAFARSGSKMPPEQSQGLSDIVDDSLGFSAHRVLCSEMTE